MPVATVDEVFAYVESFTNLEKNVGTSMRPFRLDRMDRLLDMFDHPEREFLVVHVAGSKGKGSTAAYIAAALGYAGFTTGVYASPHVSSYRERIRLSDRDVPDDVFLSCYEEIIERFELGEVTLPGQNDPTTFELLTLLSFLVFARMGCDWAVIETGIGGRLDATNLVSPVASVITPIEIEHSEVLGDTIEEIAAEKAGIIKEKVPVFTSVQLPDAIEVIRNTARLHHSKIVEIEEHIRELESASIGRKTRGTIQFLDGRSSTFTLGMNGRVQVENAALAWLVCDSLLIEAIPDDVRRRTLIETGLGNALLPGRMEIISVNPTIVLDAAHTPSSITRLIDSIRSYAEPRYLLFGSVLGKRQKEMAALLAPWFDRVIISTPGTFKPSDPVSVAEDFAQIHPHVDLLPDPLEALEELLAGDETATRVVTGSFYMVAEARDRIISLRGGS